MLDTSLSREELYQEVWSDPVSIVAKRYSISGVGLAKICRKMNIPLPPRGYWAKIKTGQTLPKEPLPDAHTWVSDRIWLTKLGPMEQRTYGALKEMTAQIRAATPPITVPAELSDPHPLVKAAARRLRRKQGWDNKKSLRSAPAEVLNIEVTESSLDRALLIMDTVVKELAKRSVSVKVNRHAKQTELNVNGTVVPLKITEYVPRRRHEITPAEEKARRQSWFSIPVYDHVPTGILTITAGRWPSKDWKDTPAKPLDKRIQDVIAGIMVVAEEMKVRQEDEARKAEVIRVAQEKYDASIRRMEQEETAFRKLKNDAEAWETSTRLRNYIDFVHRKASMENNLTPETIAWIEWAKSKAEWMDPTVNVCDVIFDAPEPKKPSCW